MSTHVVATVRLAQPGVFDNMIGKSVLENVTVLAQDTAGMTIRMPDEGDVFWIPNWMIVNAKIENVEELGI